MKRILTLLLVSVIAVGLLLPLSGCDKDPRKKVVLRICNWEDYICEEYMPREEFYAARDAGDEESEETEDEEADTVTLYDKFEEVYEAAHPDINLVIEYSTFGTPEILYNDLRINPGCYDLICPSDYMIEKMLKEDMLESFGDITETIPNYANNASGFILDLFEKQGWKEYAIPYMWGTMGYIYNPEEVTYEEASTWGVAVNPKFKNKTTIKDSVRDSYFLGVALANIDDLREKNAAFNAGEMSADDYASYLSDVFNDTSIETVDKVEAMLTQAKENSFSLEVDGGKDDMATGKILLNFAWSGDAVYVIDEAEEAGTRLNYAVPVEGSNVWYDGWVMPKGANKELACEFLDFISEPYHAILNMDYIGYTSPIVGQEVFDNMVYNFGIEDPESEDAVAVDLSYYYTTIDDAVIYIDKNERNRQFDAQYPEKAIIERCTVMKYFDNESNARINKMWNRVKAGSITLYVVVICIFAAIAVLGVIIYLLAKADLFRPRPKKGYTRIGPV